MERRARGGVTGLGLHLALGDGAYGYISGVGGVSLGQRCEWAVGEGERETRLTRAIVTIASSPKFTDNSLCR